MGMSFILCVGIWQAQRHLGLSLISKNLPDIQFSQQFCVGIRFNYFLRIGLPLISYCYSPPLGGGGNQDGDNFLVRIHFFSLFFSSGSPKPNFSPSLSVIHKKRIIYFHSIRLNFYRFSFHISFQPLSGWGLVN